MYSIITDNEFKIEITKYDLQFVVFYLVIV